MVATRARLVAMAALAGALLAVTGCSQSTQTSGTPAPTIKKIAIPTGKVPVSMGITELAISSASQPVLRIGFKLTNGRKVMLLCDAAYFYIELADGTTIAADQAADNSCTPDSLDPKVGGTGRMYFDLSAPYRGKLYLLMEDQKGKVVGYTETTIQ
jgi:hypothetical protein